MKSAKEKRTTVARPASPTRAARLNAAIAIHTKGATFTLTIGKIDWFFAILIPAAALLGLLICWHFIGENFKKK